MDILVDWPINKGYENLCLFGSIYAYGSDYSSDQIFTNSLKIKYALYVEGKTEHK